MKKHGFLIALAFTLSFSLFSSIAFAATENKVDKRVTVSSGFVLEGKDAPVLILKATTDHSEDFQFELTLEGAKWTYGDKGTIVKGVTYEKFSDTWMIVSVDMSKFDAAKKDIEIPLYTEITGNGDAHVSIDGGESTVSSGVYTFAGQAEEKIKLTGKIVKRMGENGTLNDVILEDSTTKSVKKGTKYIFRLDNGFRFTNNIVPEGTGKYKNAIRFEYDIDEPSDATITVLKDTDEGIGTITLSGLEVKKTKYSNYGTVNLTMLSGTDTYQTEVAEFVKYTDTEVPLKLLYLNESSQTPMIVGEGLPGVLVRIEIDGEELGATRVGANGRWTMQYPEGTEPLTEGKHRFAATYLDEERQKYIGEITETFTIELPYGVSFTIDSETYSVEGTTYPLDAPAYLDENGRTMLPLRAFVNAMGIKDENVDWNEKTQTVAITRNDGNKIAIKIGESSITINGVPKKIDTQAVIKNGRTFLPMRPLLNAMGINDNDIVWKPISQTVIVEVK